MIIHGIKRILTGLIMRIIEETETEIYIELEDSDLPYNMCTTGKKVHARFKPIEGNFWMGRIWKDKKDLVGLFPS